MSKPYSIPKSKNANEAKKNPYNCISSSFIEDYSNTSTEELLNNLIFMQKEQRSKMSNLNFDKQIFLENYLVDTNNPESVQIRSDSEYNVIARKIHTPHTISDDLIQYPLIVQKPFVRTIVQHQRKIANAMQTI